GPAATQIGPEPTPAEPTGSPRAPAAPRSRADGCREPAGSAGHARAARARRAPGPDATPDGRRADGQRAGARSRDAAARGEPAAAQGGDGPTATTPDRQPNRAASRRTGWRRRLGRGL